MFDLGRIVATPGALAIGERFGLDLPALLARHASGDWGDVSAEDKRANRSAIENGTRLLSAYGSGERKLWIITDGASDVCPACWAGIGTCEPLRGQWIAGTHFRNDQPPRRLSTTILRPEDY